MTFTGSISIAESGHAERRTVLMAAVACNLAWGIVDAAMYLLGKFAERARELAIFKAVGEASDPDVAHQLILDSLPAPVSSTLPPTDVEKIRRRLGTPPASISIAPTRTDLGGALGVCLLVFTSTLPVIV